MGSIDSSYNLTEDLTVAAPIALCRPHLVAEVSKPDLGSWDGEDNIMNVEARALNGTGHADRDDRKTAGFIARNLKPFKVSRVAHDFAFAREILRTPGVNQGRGGVTERDMENPDQVSFFFLDGERHRKRRASVASYFTPKAVVTRYRPLMDRTMDELIAEFQRKGSGVLDEMSLQLASNVAMEVVGLTNSDNRKLTQTIRNLMNSNPAIGKSPVYQFFHKILLGWFYKGLMIKRTMDLYNKHIVPAVEARRKEPKDDVVSYMAKENYSRKAMIIECMTYAGAGVSTTREFIVMAAWQLFDDPALMDRFLNGDEADQFAILEEILRLDPVANYVYRQSTIEIQASVSGTPVKQGEVFAINIRDVNTDESVVGECPFKLDPDRAKRMKNTGSWMSFGDGPHRCPGSQVALHESRVFLDRLLRVPGIRMAKKPQMILSVQTQGYELRGCIVTCDRT
jgi:cytochrome P450